MTSSAFRKRIIDSLRFDRALKIVWQSSAVYTACSALLLLINGVLPLLSLYLIKLIIDSVTGIISGNSGKATYSTVLMYIAFSAVVGFSIAFLTHLTTYMKKAQSISLTDHMHALIHEKSSRLDLAFYENPEYRDTLHRAQAEGPSRPASIVENLFAAGQNLFTGTAVFCLIFFFTPWLCVIMFLTVIPGIFLRLKYAGEYFQWHLARTKSERKASYLSAILTADIHAKELRIFNVGDYFIQLFNTIRGLLRKELLGFGRKKAANDFFAQAIATVSIFGSLAYIAKRTVSGDITIGDMVMYFQAFQRGLTHLKSLFENIAQMYEDNLFLSNLYSFLAHPPEVKSPDTPLPIPEKLTMGIEFRNVNFFYQNCEKNIIDCVNFSLFPGEMVALVGENGSGKTTIAKLLSRLYDPTGGCILLEGNDIRSYDLQEYRKRISVLFQDYIRYYLPIGENIYLGDTTRKDNENEIVNAAKLAGIHDKINSFDLKYRTILGKWFEDGEEMSTGQCQMLALARTIFKNADIIILDEPSSALDKKTEMDIFIKLRTVCPEKIFLVISHRLSTIQMADRILVLDEGRLTEQGDHQSLLTLKGKYAGLFKASQ